MHLCKQAMCKQAIDCPPGKRWTLRMPRKVRIQYEGAVYHAMCRGDRWEAIFADDADREKFPATLARMCGRSRMRVQAN